MNKTNLLPLTKDMVTTEHNFSDGVYIRTITMPPNSLILGAKHKTRHMNIVSKGIVTFSVDGIITTVEAPCMFESDVGVSKVLFNHNEVVWSTVHVTDETDIETLEAILTDYTIGEEQEIIVENFYKEVLCPVLLSEQ